MGPVPVEVGLEGLSVMRWCPSSRVGRPVGPVLVEVGPVGPVLVEVGLEGLSVMRWRPSSPLGGPRRRGRR